MILMIGSPFSVTGQNLVPNGDFESYSTCPTTSYGEIFKLKNWYDIVPSADYYNCNSGVPANNHGFQYPYSGSGYIGIGYSEKIAVRLLQNLEAGKTYEIELYLVPGNYCYFDTTILINLSEDSLCEYSRYYSTYILSNGSVLDDTLNWTKLSATFIANGCEKYLGIDVPFGLQDTGAVLNYYYYFFDDISLQCIDTAGCSPPACNFNSNDIIPNVFTPNGDHWNDIFTIRISNSEPTDIHCRIYDRWGIKVADFNYPQLSWDGTYDGKDVPDGVYYYYLEYTKTECGELYSKTGYVHLNR